MGQKTAEQKEMKAEESRDGRGSGIFPASHPTQPYYQP